MLLFLLGAVTVGIIVIFMHLSSSVVVVEIHWRQDLFRDSKLDVSTLSRQDTTFHIKPGATLALTEVDLIPNCTDKVCLQKLSAKEKSYFDICKERTISSSTKFGPMQDGNCHFLNGTNRYPVALASIPGSGSTWLRGLLEKLTGICTGSASLHTDSHSFI